MRTHTAPDGCGGSSCNCGTGTGTATLARPAPSINGIALSAPGVQIDESIWRERAYTELLRQEAVEAELLPRHPGPVAPELTDNDRKVIEEMVDVAVETQHPTEEECERYFEANKVQFVVGQALHVRHILFAVTAGVNVQALSVHAEKALLNLLEKNVSPDRFGQLAQELSNCPSGTQQGDLGWIGPNDCAPELATELFHQKYSQSGLGVHPRLVHSRFGLHIVEVRGRRNGQQRTYTQVRESIASQLALRSRAKALRQYMSLLVGQAQVEGIDLEAAESTLVQ